MKKTKVDRRRIRTLRSGPPGGGPVVYIMSRDQRLEDNWALLYSQELALDASQPLIVIACPTADYPEAPDRQLKFALGGLKEVEKELVRLRIPMFVIARSLNKRLPEIIKKLKASTLVFDFSPLRESRQWKRTITDRVNIPVYEVDAHNIVPVWQASPKLEYAAYTLRPKINRILPEFLTGFPTMNRHPIPWSGVIPVINWKKIEKDVEPLIRLKPGSIEAGNILESFLSGRLNAYNYKRNDPNAGSQSDLSPYLHFGQISAQRIALEARRYDDNFAAQEAFLEELIVRRELADNFCFYNPKYDSFDGFPEWAQKTLNEHRNDPRPYLYNREGLETGIIHDELWNAAQMEMVLTGKMHGYMRMYWAKKILEWSPSPDDALAYALYLNNKYELDGHDPNGYAGIAWSIGGVHDRPWFEREIFGKIRYMSHNGCKRKFAVDVYINRVDELKSKVIA